MRYSPPHLCIQHSYRHTNEGSAALYRSLSDPPKKAPLFCSKLGNARNPDHLTVLKHTHTQRQRKRETEREKRGRERERESTYFSCTGPSRSSLYWISHSSLRHTHTQGEGREREREGWRERERCTFSAQAPAGPAHTGSHAPVHLCTDSQTERERDKTDTHFLCMGHSRSRTYWISCSGLSLHTHQRERKRETYFSCMGPSRSSLYWISVSSLRHTHTHRGRGEGEGGIEREKERETYFSHTGPSPYWISCSGPSLHRLTETERERETYFLHMGPAGPA